MRIPDKEIVKRLASTDPKTRIIISPLMFPADQISAAAIDLHLGTEFWILDTSSVECFDPRMTDKEFRALVRSARKAKSLTPENFFILHPRELVLASTLEWIRIPEDLVGRLDGRSRWARLGIKVHSTAGDIQPGSFGVIVFELQTDGGVPFKLYPGMRIAQLSFYLLSERPAEAYCDKSTAHLQGQLGPSLGPYPDDIELDILRRAA
jgi:dCTP deaminase